MSEANENTQGPSKKQKNDAKIKTVIKEYNSIKQTFLSKNPQKKEEKTHLIKLFLQKTEEIKKELYKLEANDELVKVLRFERQRNILPKRHNFKLNELESALCEDTAVCRRVPKTAGMFLEIGKRCKYSRDFDEERGEDMFTFYVPRIVEPEDQISRELAWKIDQGFMPKEEDYPEAYTQYHRFNLRHSEFTKYFDPEGFEETIF